MNNQKIRLAAMNNGVRLWQIAAKLGIAEATFLRKMRFELPEKEQERVIGAIKEIIAEREGI